MLTDSLLLFRCVSRLVNAQTLLRVFLVALLGFAVLLIFLLKGGLGARLLCELVDRIFVFSVISMPLNRGTLYPAAFEPFELFVGWSASIPGWICVALGAYCFSSVAVGECLDPYAQPPEAIAHSFLTAARARC